MTYFYENCNPLACKYTFKNITLQYFSGYVSSITKTSHTTLRLLLLKEKRVLLPIWLFLISCHILNDYSKYNCCRTSKFSMHYFEIQFHISTYKPTLVLIYAKLKFWLNIWSFMVSMLLVLVARNTYYKNFGKLEALYKQKFE